MLADWFTTCGYPALWNRLQKFPAPSSFFPRSEVDRRLDLYRYLESIINFKVERALLDSSILCRRVCGARSFAPSFFRRQCGRRVVNLCTCGNLTLILSSRFFLLFFFCFSHRRGDRTGIIKDRFEKGRSKLEFTTESLHSWLGIFIWNMGRNEQKPGINAGNDRTVFPACIDACEIRVYNYALP